MEQIKLNEKHILPGSQRYFILKEEGGKLIGTLYEPDGQRILSCLVSDLSFDAVLDTFQKVSRGADKIKEIVSVVVSDIQAKPNRGPGPFFNMELSPDEGKIDVKGDSRSLIALLGTLFTVHEKYIPIFEAAIELSKKKGTEAKQFSKTTAPKWQA